jgi:hypothetical protein
MGDPICKLAKVLDTLPNGTRRKRGRDQAPREIFDPDQAELLCELRLAFEPRADRRAHRTPAQGSKKLIAMNGGASSSSVRLGGTWLFKLCLGVRDRRVQLPLRPEMAG